LFAVTAIARDLKPGLSRGCGSQRAGQPAGPFAIGSVRWKIRPQMPAPIDRRA
jgi:hypothetical protein